MRRNPHQTRGRIKDGIRVKGAFGTQRIVGLDCVQEHDEAVRQFKKHGPSYPNPDGQLRERRPSHIEMKGRRKVKHGSRLKVRVK